MTEKKSIFFSILSLLPLKRIIFFESAPDLSDNTKAVFDEMIKRNYNKNNKMVWWVSDKNANLPIIDNVVYCDKNSLFHKLQYFYYRTFCRCMVFCNKSMSKYNNKQFSMYLTHGSPIKDVKGKYTMPCDLDYALSAGETFADKMADLHMIDTNKMVSLGYPRNDALYIKRDIKHMFETKFEKSIIWYPTFRQHKDGGKTGSNKAIPIIDNKDNAIAINEQAKKNNVLIIIKPHFAQDISMIKSLDLSNILFIDDSFYKKNKIDSYTFIANCDAMLTDYSSVYYDYTLCNKPIGAVWEDIEDYRKNPGFSVDLNYYWQGAEKIYTVNDLNKFIENVANDIDVLKEERTTIKNVVNHSDDGKNAARVVDFIVKNNRWIEN